MPDVAVEQEVARIVRTVAKLRPEVAITPASRFIEELGIDSLDLASVILETFDRYGIPTRGDTLPPLATVGELIRFVTRDRRRLEAAVDHERHAAGALPRPHITTAGAGPGREFDSAEPPAPASLAARVGGWRVRLGEVRPLVGAALLSYERGSAWLRWLAKARWPRRLLFAAHADLVRRCLGPLGATERPEEAVRLSIASNLWDNWRLAALAALAPERFAEWARVDGFVRFERAHAEGRGVILLHSHLPGHMLALLHLVRSGYSDVVAIGMTSSQLEALRLRRLKRAMLADETVWRGLRGLRFAHQLAVGERTLRQGGIVLIAADGQLGGRFRQQPFHGRYRPVGVGFAELAAQTGAEVLPVFTTLELSGRITIAFEQPLARHGGPREEQVDRLTRQYAQRLERVWSRHAGNVTWHALAKFLAFPPVDADAAVPAH